MIETVSLSAARARGGVRLLMLRGLPSPWGQAAKSILELKSIPFVRAYQEAEDPSSLLREWTGQDSYPVLAYERERPRPGWADILLLAERLEPTPRLIPADPAGRTLVFGLAHEICGEMGLGWCGRLLTIDAQLREDPGNAFFAAFGAKYGYSPAAVAAAPRRCVEVLGQLDALLVRSTAAGTRYLLGADLGALDVYWAAFSNVLLPLPPDRCPMPDAFRPMFTCSHPEVVAALTPRLLAHRDFVYEHHLRLPMEL
ncbi:MAG TPA: hypothetical protein VGK30_16755 [Candidatus Binatia bacterium]|jgi:glutathione S-transferase